MVVWRITFALVGFIALGCLAVLLMVGAGEAQNQWEVCRVDDGVKTCECYDRQGEKEMCWDEA